MTTLRTLQMDVGEAWTGESYCEGFRQATALLPNLMAAHAAVHLVKAAGKVIAAIEPADHGGAVDRIALARALADTIICAVRVADVIDGPGNRIDIDAAVTARLGEIRRRQAPADHQTA